jgi:hypothetical protein
MVTLHALLLNNGLPNQPILLVEPHRNYHGIWRIKFSYDNLEPLSMDAQQASALAISLHQMGEDELAREIEKRSGARFTMKQCNRRHRDRHEVNESSETCLSATRGERYG